MGIESGDGGAFATNLYYKQNVSTFFGPICADGIILWEL